jgi:YbbR domain-containing protein
MAKKILKTLTNNLGFKILACVLAFILWLVVYNIDDPRKTKTYTTNITMENASAVTDKNKCYEIVGGINTVTFSVTGKRSELDKLEDTDFVATADLNRMIVDKDETSASVPIEITCKRNSSSLSINDKNKYLQITIEDLAIRRLMITADTSGKVADGYALGEVSITNPNVLSVSGPKSIVDKISKVVATIDVDGMSMNLSDNVIPLLYDEDGNEVDITRLTLSSDTVAISAKILSVKEIPLAFSTTGTPYGDYRVVEISSTPKTIKLKGTSTVLNPLISIEVPGDVLNVSGAHEDITTTIDITEYLPDGAELVDASEATITVTVRIEPYESKTYQLSSDSISVVGLGDGYEISYTKDSIPVTISGLKKDLNKLTVATLLSSIDVSGLGEGTHQVTLNLELDEESYAYQSIRIEIQISRVKDTQDDNSTDSTDNDDGTDSNDDEEEN